MRRPVASAVATESSAGQQGTRAKLSCPFHERFIYLPRYLDKPREKPALRQTAGKERIDCRKVQMARAAAALRAQQYVPDS